MAEKDGGTVSHDRTAETVVVWSGDFAVEFRDHVSHLARGRCCVVPLGAEHRGTSKAGAEVILFQHAPTEPEPATPMV